MNWANVLEDPIALEFARVTGKKVARLNRMIQHKSRKNSMNYEELKKECSSLFNSLKAANAVIKKQRMELGASGAYATF